MRRRQTARALARALRLTPKQLADLGDFLLDDAEQWADDASMCGERKASFVVGRLCHELAIVAREAQP